MFLIAAVVAPFFALNSTQVWICEPRSDNNLVVTKNLVTSESFRKLGELKLKGFDDGIGLSIVPGPGCELVAMHHPGFPKSQTKIIDATTLKVIATVTYSKSVGAPVWISSTQFDARDSEMSVIRVDVNPKTRAVRQRTVKVPEIHSPPSHFDDALKVLEENRFERVTNGGNATTEFTARTISNYRGECIVTESGDEMFVCGAQEGQFAFDASCVYRLQRGSNWRPQHLGCLAYSVQLAYSPGWLVVEQRRGQDARIIFYDNAASKWRWNYTRRSIAFAIVEVRSEAQQ